MKCVVLMAIAAGIPSAALLSGCAAPSVTKPVLYRGQSHGVRFTLSVEENASTLTVRFTARGEAIRQRALHTPRLDAFCLWPEGNGGGLNTLNMRLRPRQHTETLPAGVNGSSAPYTCGLHTRTATTEGWPWSSYVRHAFVSTRLLPVHG